MKTGSPISDRSQTFGRRLRAAREARGRSLKQIAEITKISASVLDALEHDDPSKLPGGIFMRSFIRSFATEVGLNPETTLQEFFRAFPSHAPAADEEAVEGAPGFAGWRAVAGGAAALLFCVATIAGGYALVTNPPDWLHWPRSSPAEPQAPVQTPVQSTSPAPAPTSKPATAEDAVPVAPEPADVQRASADATSEPAPVVPASAPVPATQEAQQLTPVPGGVQLAIHPRASCWVRVTAAGRVRVARLMRAGEREIIDVAGPMTIEVGDAGAFDFSINGEPGRPLGPAGKVVRASISRDNLSAFLARP